MTKQYPHKKHPAKYRYDNNDEVKYITFTHSPEIELNDGQTIQTVPLSENISPEERKKNKQEGKKRGENRSYAYPKVFKGKRSSLGSETTKFKPTEFDKKRINKMFEIFPEENVPVTGGEGQYRKRKKSKKK